MFLTWYLVSFILNFVTLLQILKKKRNFISEPKIQWRGGRGARAPQRRENMGAPKAPSVLRGRQMPKSSIHTKSRCYVQMRQEKVSEIFCLNYILPLGLLKML